MAEEGKLDPVVDVREIERVCQFWADEKRTTSIGEPELENPLLKV
jgi:hypothetical protein